MISNDDTPDTLDTPPPEEEPIGATPVEQEKPKKRAKKPAKKSARKAKVAKRAKGKGAPAKKSPRASASTAKSTASRRTKTRRSPKGNPPEKVLRKGDAAYGKRVKAARVAKGWTQRELQARAGVTQGCISNVEKGTMMAGIPTQKLFKKYLGVPLTKACESAIASGRTRMVQADIKRKRK